MSARKQAASLQSFLILKVGNTACILPEKKKKMGKS